MDYFQLVTQGLAKHLGIDASEITLDTELMTLGVDSLDAAELLMSLEDAIGVEVETKKKIATTRDLVNAIEEAIQANQQ
ncbi:MAG: phosphopantetheine-binding protein [Planctomycetia bacterium]|nr:phosphopantetheine-binding protein [Planctomycetia bacterium]